MRINIETTPLNRIEWWNKSMYFHYWNTSDSIGICLLTIRFMYSKVASWSGFSLGIHIWETKGKRNATQQ